MNVFVDTGAWYALADDSDRHAEKARAFYKKHLETDSFLTTDAILFETWHLLRGKLGWPAAHRFVDNLRKSGIRVMTLEPRDLDAAWDILNEYGDRELSFVDATSFAVMERCRISRAFTFDKDFFLYRCGPNKQHAFTCCP